MNTQPRVIIIGAGLGGLAAAADSSSAPATVSTLAPPCY